MARHPEKASNKDTLGKARRLPLTVEELPDGNYLPTTGATTLETKTRLENTTGIVDWNAGATLTNSLLNNLFDFGLLETNGALAMMADIQPQGALEGMLAAQAVACHLLGMKQLEQAQLAIRHEVQSHHYKQANRLLSLFTKQTEALHRLRHGNRQTVVVQHVHVEAGGQAAIAGTIMPQ